MTMKRTRGSVAAMVLISACDVAFTSPVKMMPVSDRRAAPAYRARVRLRFPDDARIVDTDFGPIGIEWKRRSGSPQRCGGGRKRMSLHVALPHGLSGGTLLLSSICRKSTSRTRPAPSTTTAMSPRGMTRTETAPAGIQITSTTLFHPSAASPS